MKTWAPPGFLINVDMADPERAWAFHLNYCGDESTTPSPLTCVLARDIISRISVTFVGSPVDSSVIAAAGGGRGPTPFGIQRSASFLNILPQAFRRKPFPKLCLKLDRSSSSSVIDDGEIVNLIDRSIILSFDNNGWEIQHSYSSIPKNHVLMYNAHTTSSVSPSSAMGVIVELVFCGNMASFKQKPPHRLAMKFKILHDVEVWMLSAPFYLYGQSGFGRRQKNQKHVVPIPPPAQFDLEYKNLGLPPPWLPIFIDMMRTTYAGDGSGLIFQQQVGRRLLPFHQREQSTHTVARRVPSPAAAAKSITSLTDVDPFFSRIEAALPPPPPPPPDNSSSLAVRPDDDLPSSPPSDDHSPHHDLFPPWLNDALGGMAALPLMTTTAAPSSRSDTTAAPSSRSDTTSPSSCVAEIIPIAETAAIHHGDDDISPVWCILNDLY